MPLTHMCSPLPLERSQISADAPQLFIYAFLPHVPAEISSRSHSEVHTDCLRRRHWQDVQLV